MKKFWAVVLSIALLGGCTARQQEPALSEAGNDPQASAPLGRYVETEWSLPPLSEDFHVLRIKPAETGYDLGVSENGLPRRFHSENGKDWEEADAALLQAAASKGGWISGLDWTEDGRYFLLAYDSETEKMSVQRSGENGWETLPIDWTASGEELFPQNLSLGADGSLFFADGMDTTYRYSVDGAYLNRYPGVSFGTPLSDRIAGYLDGSREILFCALDSGEELERTPVDAAVLSGGGYPLLEADGDGLCMVSTGGIFRLASGGSLFEQLLSGSACSLGKPSLSPMDCVSGTDGSFLVRLTDRENGTFLFHYAYRPDIPAHPDKELTVASLSEQPTLRQAAAEFQAAHPEVLVTLQILWEQEGGMTKNDALRALNTELLAGSGPDILALDGLPLASYEEKGVLDELSPTVSPLLEDGTLLKNIAGAFSREKGIYALPARFTVPMLCTPSEHADWEDLPSIARWAQENPGKRPLYNLEPQALIRLFYPACFSVWTGEAGQIDEAALTEFLSCIKTLSESGGGEAFPDDLDALFGGEIPADLDEELREKIKEVLAPIRMAYGRTESFALQFEFSRFSDFRTPYAAMGVRLGRAPTPEETTQYLRPLPGMGETVFIPRCILGINAAGAQKELALAFLETVLSESVQSANLQDGLAVHAAALAASVDTADSWTSSQRDPEGNSLLEEVTPVEAQLPLIETFRSLTVPAMTDETLLGFLTEESAPFFTGERTAEQAAQAYAQRARAYLSE